MPVLPESCFKNYLEISSYSSQNGEDQKQRNKQMVTKAGMAVGNQGHLVTVGGSASWYSHYQNQCGSCSRSWR